MIAFSFSAQMKNIEKFNVKTVKLFIASILLAVAINSCHSYIINDGGGDDDDDAFKRPPTSSASSIISTTYDELVTADQLFLHFPDDQITTSSKYRLM